MHICVYLGILDYCEIYIMHTLAEIYIYIGLLKKCILREIWRVKVLTLCIREKKTRGIKKDSYCFEITHSHR